MKFDANKGSALGKHFISLKDGEKVKGVLRGEPVTFRTHWENNRSSVCDGTDCEKCKAGNKATFRFRLNMIVADENGKPEAKVLEQGWKFYGMLADLNEEYPLDKNYVTISRKGKGMNDTVYSILPIKDKTVSEETEKKLSDVKLLPLSPNDPFWNSQHSSGGAAVSDADEEMPF